MAKAANTESTKVQLSIHPRVRYATPKGHFGDARDNPDYKGQRSTMPSKKAI